MRTDRTEGKRRAFTLLELMISIGLIGIILGSLAMVSSASDRAMQTSSVKTHLEAQSGAAVERVIGELRLAVGASVQPVLADGEATDWIEYSQVAGLDAAKVVLSPKRRIALELQEGELDDGVDNNGNGLVDERRLVVTENVGEADERTLVVTRWVRGLMPGEETAGVDDDGNGITDEAGFTLTRSGGTYTVRLAFERLDGDGRPLRREARSSTSLRN